MLRPATHFATKFNRLFTRSAFPWLPQIVSESCLPFSMKGWVLECLQRLHEPIPLPDNTPIRLGRSPQTGITDPRCSRLQVEVQVSWKTKEIKVTQLGVNVTAVDGKDLERGKTVTVSPGSTIFILKGEYPHRVVHQGKERSVCSTSEDAKQSDMSVAGQDSVRRGSKRPADDRNGVGEDNSPEKKRKSAKSSRSESPAPEKEARKAERREKSSPKKRTSDEEKSSRSEKPSKTKLTDFFSIPKDKSSEKRRREHSENNSTDGASPTNKEEKHRNTDKQQQNSQGDQDKATSETNARSKADRKSMASNSVAECGGKKRSQDLSDDDDDDSHVKSIAEKLEQLKKNVKREEESSAAASRSSKTNSSSAEKRKNSAELSAKSKVRRSSKAAAESSWQYDDEKLCIFTSEGVVASERIAGFDIDGTIITTQSGRVFPKDMDDWRIWMPDVYGKLKKLIARGYKVVFFTNQLGVGRGKVKISDLQDKFEKVAAKLQIPVQIFISTTGGSFRKPALGMWQILKKQWNDGIPVAMADSFYVGDAAGRQENWAPKKKKDFSCSDRLFAINAGLKFYTPEEFFLGHKPAAFKLPDFDPRAVSTDGPLLQGGENLTSDKQEVVVLVGFQAAGKSTFAKTHLVPKGYEYVNQDNLKTWQRCVSECSKTLAAGKSVVIDNTNVDPETRARYIECARKVGAPCRCFFFDFSISHCRHNERFREITVKDHKPINEQIFNSTKSRFKPPQAGEGFSKVVKVNFVPQFSDKIHSKIYRQFLLEK